MFEIGHYGRFNELARKQGITVTGDFRIVEVSDVPAEQIGSIGVQWLKLDGYPNVVGSNLMDQVPCPTHRVARNLRDEIAPFGS
ncbi:MAG TPA: hypothetical protein VN086_02020 [Candidatus Paceibacterota bacterium]|nr:hypothetical protein [Candidatus Paceibacterota bacterium]